MAGILDKKTRFVDTLFTDQGRKQLAKGELRFEFASFSDFGTFYDSSIEDPTVSADSTDRIMLEAFSRQQDLIIPEFDNDGNTFFPAGDFNISSGKLISVSGSVGVISGSSLAVSSFIAIGNSLESLQELRPLRDRQSRGRGNKFTISQNSKTFRVNSSGPLQFRDQKVKRLSNAESLWQDERLTHVDNFMFLPPVNKGSSHRLYDYPKLERPEPMSFTEIEDRLGVGSDWKYTNVADVDFLDTSMENNIVCQVWEVTEDSLTKLRVIDFGEFVDNDAFSAGKHVFFVGKLREDGAGQNTFLNLFTVVFD